MAFDILQVVLGGGQDASHVTTTDRRAGKFEAKFFHKVGNFYIPFQLRFNSSSNVMPLIQFFRLEDFFFNRFFKRKLEV